MKKAYINPETSIVLLTTQAFIATSNPDGFKSTLDEDDKITKEEDMLSRRKSVWDDGMEEEEEQW